MPHLRIEPTGAEPAAVTGSAVRERSSAGAGKSGRDDSGGPVRYVPLGGPDGYSSLTIGRYPDCEVTLDVPTVSRRHARITRGDAAEGGGFYLEDLGSRNATLLRGEPVQGRVKLRDRDEIVICDVTLRFVATTPPPEADDEPGSGDSVLDSNPGVNDTDGSDDPAMVTVDPPFSDRAGGDGDPDGATVEGAAHRPPDGFNSPTDRHGAAEEDAALDDEADEDDTTRKKLPQPAAAGGAAGRTRPKTSDTDSHYDYKFTDEAAGVLAALPATRVGGYRLDVNPEAKLRAVLSITRDLVGSDGLNRVLDRTLASLFNAFPQADRGFVMLAEEPGAEPTVRATRTRPALGSNPAALDDEGDGGEEVRISRTIVKRVMETGEAILSLDVGGDSRFDASSSLADLQLRSVVCIPLHGREETPFGVLQLDTADPTRQFSEDDLDLLRAVSVPIGLAAENARLTLESARRREAERDLELAAHIQQGFLPQAPPPLEGYEFADCYESAQSVGGDYFDYIPLPDGRLAIALGDVAGKGVPAALLMARLSAAARAQLLGAAGKKSPDVLSSALRRLNRELTAGPMGHRFITCVMLLLDPRTHCLYAVNAGHMAPLVRTASGSVEPLDEVSGGMPLGIDAEQRFEVASRTLRPGEGALIFTDGITEAVREGAGDRSPGGRDAGKELDARAKGLYGRERLAAVYGRTAGAAADVIDAVCADVAAWTGCGPQTDDICAVALRRSA
ncbi:SpoIIE family protein phosphatase [Alienimonas sp. DA493]|uniref:SpoIIE family protein phosphatase n=1 Tax=Alienimonas sp. DA493 TaxID=3373605 RepID=UPI003754A084